MSEATAVFDLSTYNISESTGFIPSVPPLPRLIAACFARWEYIVSKLAVLIKEKTIRKKIDQLQPTDFTEDTLTTEEEWQRAYVVLTFLSQAYLWAEDEAGLPEKVPKILAVPWCHVSDHLGLPPVGTYAAVVVFNYALHNPDGPMDADNVYCPVTYTDTTDESWFYVVPLLIELAGVPALKAMVEVTSAVTSRNNGHLCSLLNIITESLKNSQVLIQRMFERCNAKVFYTQIRPFQAGSKGLDAFPEGLIYEGVDPEPRMYHGASAGQSPMIHAYDVFFGAQHHGPDEEFLHAMRKHMPPNHSAFLSTLATQPSVRDYIKGTGNTDLIQCFNSAVEAFTTFRSNHIKIVTQYIVNQKQHSQNASLEAKGTGGTSFMIFLKNVRDNTAALKIPL